MGIREPFFIMMTIKILSINFASSLLYSDKIITGSFDKTSKVWSSSTGKCLNTFYGHKAEIVAAEFNPMDSSSVVSASMDSTARVYDVETGQEMHCFDGHRAEVISARFNRHGDMLLTGSFDHSAMLWDLRSKE